MTLVVDPRHFCDIPCGHDERKLDARAVERFAGNHPFPHNVPIGAVSIRTDRERAARQFRETGVAQEGVDIGCRRRAYARREIRNYRFDIKRREKLTLYKIRRRLSVGRIEDVFALPECETDEDARLRLRCAVDGTNLEVWCGMRFVANLPEKFRYLSG